MNTRLVRFLKWSVSSRGTFYGHGVFPNGLGANIVVGIIAPIQVLILIWMLDVRMLPDWYIALYSIWVLLSMPQATYMFLEIKHLLFKDGIADDLEAPAVIVFSGISAIGFVAAVLTVVFAVNGIDILTANIQQSILILSFLSALGAVFGLLDLPLFAAAWPPTIIHYLWKVISSPKLVLLTVGLTTLIAISCILFQIAYIRT